jgi:hypothetical protein
MDVIDFPRDKDVDYPKEQEICNRIFDVINEYEGEVSTVAILGILDMVHREYLD